MGAEELPGSTALSRHRYKTKVLKTYLKNY
jgi:hypothetical protein